MQTIASAARYWLCQAKWNSARKNAKLKQNKLKVRIRRAQTATKPLESLGEAAPANSALLGESRRSTHKTTPCMAPNTTKVQFAPCQRPARSIVLRRFRRVLQFPSELPPNGIYR